MRLPKAHVKVANAPRKAYDWRKYRGQRIQKAKKTWICEALIHEPRQELRQLVNPNPLEYTAHLSITLHNERAECGVARAPFAAAATFTICLTRLAESFVRTVSIWGTTFRSMAASVTRRWRWRCIAWAPLTLAISYAMVLAGCTKGLDRTVGSICATTAMTTAVWLWCGTGRWHGFPQRNDDVFDKGVVIVVVDQMSLAIIPCTCGPTAFLDPIGVRFEPGSPACSWRLCIRHSKLTVVEVLAFRLSPGINVVHPCGQRALIGIRPPTGLRWLRASVRPGVIVMDFNHDLLVIWEDQCIGVLYQPAWVGVLQPSEEHDACGVRLSDDGKHRCIHLVELICCHLMWLVENFEEQGLVLGSEAFRNLRPDGF